MIRPAVLSDSDRCVELATKFYGNFMLAHGIEMRDEDLKKTVDYFISSGQNVVLERDGAIVGMAAWAITPHPANFRCKIFQEILWCCESSNLTDALKLLRALENRAIESEADIFMLANLSLDTEPALRRIYDKMGYQYAESHYSKRRF